MAALALLRRDNVVLGDQLQANFDLALHLIAHGGHLLNRPDKLLRLAVTVQAPGHAEWFRLVDNIHPVDPAVAGLTPHSDTDVDFVVEVSVVGKVMNPDPLDGITTLPALTHRLQRFTVDCNLIVTVHTGLRGRNIGLIGVEYLRMTVLTIESDLTDVLAMAEWNRLLRGIANICKFRRKEVPDQKYSSIKEDDNTDEKPLGN